MSVTSTPAELAVLDAAEEVRSDIGGNVIQPDEYRLLLVAEALDEVAWHSFDRFTVATNIAREYLEGRDASSNEQIFYDQNDKWNELRLDLRHSTDKARFYQGVPYSHDWSGRGGTAVWRARRKVEVQDFEDWLMESPTKPQASADWTVSPPGWLVRMPNGWRSGVFPAGQDLPARIANWLKAGRVMILPIQNKRVVWPLSNELSLPVPGVEPLVRVARDLRPEDVIGLVESILVVWGKQVDQNGGPPELLLPVDKAFEFGYVTAEERKEAMASARAYTLHRRSSQSEGEGERVVLDPVPMISDPRFCLMPTRRRTGRTAKPMWLWPGGSIAAEVEAQTPDETLGWLAVWASRIARRELQASMERAWHDGFDHHPDSFWRPKAPDRLL